MQHQPCYRDCIASMIPSMARMTITVPDEVAEHIRAAAGGNVSAWFTRLAQRELLRQAGPYIAAYEAAHDDPEDEDRRLAGLA
jgi:hypothetical protein